MARKKKFNDYIGFLWNTADIEKVEVIAKSKDLTSSDIFREAMRLFFAVQEGSATVTYLINPVLAQAGITADGVTGIANHPEIVASPEPGTENLPDKNA